MSRPLKMWIGNLDGERTGMVIATTKKRAVEVIGTSLRDFNNYWTIQNHIDSDADPETLYTCPSSEWFNETLQWHKGKCPL